MSSRQKPTELPEDLSSGTRETQIVRFAALGFTDKEIAEKLSLSPNTVYTYWRRVRARYGSSSRGEAISRYLHESFDHFRRIVETLPDCVFIVQRGRIEFASPAVRNLLSVHAEEAVGQPISNLIDTSSLPVADDRNVRFGTERTPPTFARIRSNGEIPSAAILLSSMPIEWHGRAASLVLIRPVGGDYPAGNLSAAISDADSLPDLMAILTLDGQCLDCRATHAPSRILSCEETIGHNYRDTLPAPMVAALDEAIRKLRSNEAEVTVQAEVSGGVKLAARCSLIREDRVLVLVRRL